MNPNGLSFSPLDQQLSREIAHETGKDDSPGDQSEEELHAEELDYHAVPPRKVIKVMVRYRHCGRGRPMPYPLDDEAGE